MEGCTRKRIFEAPILKAYPEIAAIKQALYDDGAAYASMSKSGSTVFGIYTADQTIGIQKNQSPLSGCGKRSFEYLIKFNINAV